MASAGWRSVQRGLGVVCPSHQRPLGTDLGHGREEPSKRHLQRLPGHPLCPPTPWGTAVRQTVGPSWSGTRSGVQHFYPRVHVLPGWTFNEEPSKDFYSLAKKMGCEASSSWSDSMYHTVMGGQQRAEHERVLACLRKADLARLREAAVFEGDEFDTNPWVPSVDGEFLPRAPGDLLRDAEYLATNGVISRDVMMGINNDEGGLVWKTEESTDPKAKSSKLGRQVVSQLLEKELTLRYGDEISIDSSRMDTLVNVLEFFYTKPLSDNGEVKLQGSSARSSSAGRRYVYLFNHRPARKVGQLEVDGIFHGEDMGYEFDPASFFPRDGFNAEDETVATTFRLMLTSFAKTGQPQLTLEQQFGSYWPEYTSTEEKYLSLEATPRVEGHLYNKRVALWLDLVPSVVNSTRSETRNSFWNLPWQQQRNGCNAYSYNTMYNYNDQVPFAMGKSFFFKGRVSLYKLPQLFSPRRPSIKVRKCRRDKNAGYTCDL